MEDVASSRHSLKVKREAEGSGSKSEKKAAPM
jgi:hypothetical protein